MAVSPNSPIANPNVPLSGAALIAAAHALANAQTSGPLAALATQIAQNNAQNRQAINTVGGYFGQLGNLAQQGVTDQGQTASALNTQLAQIAQDEQGTLGQVGQDAAASAARYSPQASSNTVNPGLAGLATEMAKQQGIAAQQQGAFRAYGATQGANFGNLAASNLGTTALRGQEDLTQLANAGQVKNEPLMAQNASLLAARGADYTTALGKLRQQQIANTQANAGLGIKQQALNVSTANNQRTTAASVANNQRTTATSAANNQRTTSTSAANSQRTANTAANANNPNLVGSPAWARVQNSTGTTWSQNPNAVGSPAWARAQKQTAASTPGGAHKPLTTLENNHFWATVGQIESFIRDGNAHGQTEAQIRDALGNGSNIAKKSFDPEMVQTAYELVGYNGKINQSTAGILRNQYGATGGTYNNVPIKVTPDYKPPLTNAIPTIGNAVANAAPTVGG